MSESWMLIAAALLLAGAVKGLFGMGLPTVSMGLLGLVMPPVHAAALLVIPTIATNVWQLAAGPALTLLMRRFAGLMVGVAVGTLIGLRVLTGGSATLTGLALGSVLLIYGIAGLVFRPLVIAATQERWLSPLLGLATGIVNGATGVAVVPLVPYLNSLQLPRDELIQALGLMFSVAMVVLALGLMHTGHFRMTSVGPSALTLIPVGIGLFAGTRIRTRLQAAAFQRWFFVGLIVLGSCMILRALM